MKKSMIIPISVEKGSLKYNDEIGGYEVPVDLIKESLTDCLDNSDTKASLSLLNHIIEGLNDCNEESKLYELAIKLLSLLKQGVDDSVYFSIFNTMLVTLRAIKREYF